MATIDDIQDLIDTLLAAYPRFEPKDFPAFARVWAKALGGYSASTLERVADAWMKQGSEWFPNLPEVIALCEQYKSAPVPTNNHQYWQAMSLFNASLRGEVSEQQLYQDKTWKAYEKNRGTSRV
jgi:hypothetical protein